MTGDEYAQALERLRNDIANVFRCPRELIFGRGPSTAVAARAVAAPTAQDVEILEAFQGSIKKLLEPPKAS